MLKSVYRLALLCALAFPVSSALAQATPAFDATVIKPAKPDATGRDWDRDNNDTRIGNYSLADLILRAYNLKASSQLIGAPEWADKVRYDIHAKVSADEYKRMEKLSPQEGSEEYRVILRSMLADRFGLRVEKTTRHLPRFVLQRVSASAMGPGLKTTPAGPDGRAVGGRSVSTHEGDQKGTMDVSGVTMDDVAEVLSGRSEVGKRVVVNQTGLPGFFAFKLDYAPDHGMGVSPDATLPSLLDQMRTELGLKLVKDEGDVPVIVVTAAKQPELD